MSERQKVKRLLISVRLIASLSFDFHPGACELAFNYWWFLYTLKVCIDVSKYNADSIRIHCVDFNGTECMGMVDFNVSTRGEIDLYRNFFTNTHLLVRAINTPFTAFIFIFSVLLKRHEFSRMSTFHLLLLCKQRRTEGCHYCHK